ncbi:MAG: pyruvate, phosphate dikinase [Gammaproteobacteria bacterium]|nr:pyruvate, phosphate dikinase [Gammaproteobacteria bacterium]
MTEQAAGSAVAPRTAKKYAYRFDQLQDVINLVDGGWEDVRALLGGKGANLADMSALGVPVPPGFTLTTDACNDYLAGDESMPPGLWDQVVEVVATMEGQSGHGFGDADNPLLVSCRSGARFSMPGMMDTVLNIGLNDDVARRLVIKSGDDRFVYDLYRRLVQMFGSVVMGVPDEVFEAVISAQRRRLGVSSDSALGGEHWRVITARFKEIYRTYVGEDFPRDPYEQLKLAIEAVFKSWKGKRAEDYRNAAGIPHDLGTAVNVQTMVFGNMGGSSGTGVAMSRNASNGERELEGDFLMKAQGEDVVAGIRKTQPLAELGDEMPEIYREFADIAERLENHYRNVQDIEFTIEEGKLWILQTRDAKRTAQAEVRCAVDMVEEGLINQQEALRRVSPEQVDFFLHPQLDTTAVPDVEPFATGLNVSPGAAVGMVALDATVAERWANDEDRDVIMVRPETKPDDVHGMLAAKGVVTCRGGRTSHAALVARQFGKPAVVGIEELVIDLDAREMRIGDHVIREGDYISIDGTNGLVYLGEIPTLVPDLSNPHLLKLLTWADEVRELEVWANADYPRDADRARSYGAEGIGLCRTEHMFFESDRLPIVQRMIMARDIGERNEALAELLPMQRADFEGLFRSMDGRPVTIRLIDPPLHEFLPSYDQLVQDLSDLKVRIQHYNTMSEIDAALEQIRVKQNYLERVEALREENPMLGTRGVRLGILLHELTRMQVRAVFEAACACVQEGLSVKPQIMIPLVAHVEELRLQRDVLEKEAEEVLAEFAGIEVDHLFGTMIEIPRAAITAAEIAEVAQFFSFGTNDLTQMTFGISRDDGERFLREYQKRGILNDNPFETLDTRGVGELLKIAVRDGRGTNAKLHLGICGEHGGDPASIAFCHQLGLDYVSCSPFRVPIARLAAAQAALPKEESMD